MNRDVFESGFDSQCKEIIVLMETTRGARSIGDNNWSAAVFAMAYIDVDTNELVEGKQRLTWFMTNEECRSKEAVFSLKDEHVYRMKIRASLPHPNAFDKQIMMPYGDEFLVVEVLERDCEDERLKAFYEEYQKPVVLMTELVGELVLNKRFGSYEGVGLWNGEECGISLDTDEEGSVKAEGSLATLKALFEEATAWDEGVRKYAAKELTELANEWYEPEVDDYDDDDEDAEMEPAITEETFARRIYINEIVISSDGSFALYYSADGMFTDHGITVRGDLAEGIYDATVE